MFRACDEVIETRWYAILEDLTLEEYISPNSKVQAMYWLKKTFTGKTYTTSYSNTYGIFTYETFDNELNPVSIEEKGWKIVRIYDNPQEKHFYELTRFVISDRTDTERTIQYWEERGLLSCIRLLIKNSIFNSWAEVDLQTSNERLEKELATLQKKVKKYKKISRKINKKLKDTDYGHLIKEETT